MIVGDDLRVVPLTLDEERAQWADTQVGPYEGVIGAFIGITSRR